MGLALAYSATAGEGRRVEAYGKERDGDGDGEGGGRWNGRVILALGDRYTELEEGIAGTRGEWFGGWNAEMTRLQQAATDFRDG